jgi:hypothetical protein
LPDEQEDGMNFDDIDPAIRRTYLADEVREMNVQALNAGLDRLPDHLTISGTFSSGHSLTVYLDPPPEAGACLAERLRWARTPLDLAHAAIMKAAGLCSVCSGVGSTQVEGRTGVGFVTCPTCRGDGRAR